MAKTFWAKSLKSKQQKTRSKQKKENLKMVLPLIFHAARGIR
jgi:hypothetical protein